MRTAMLAVATFLCLPLWAEDDPYANMPITFSLEWGPKGSAGRYESDIFDCRVSHNGTFVNQIDMDWAVLTSGPACRSDHERKCTVGITAKYLEEPIGNHQRLVGQYDKSPGMYLQLHRRSSFAELRLYYPLANRIDGQDFYPWLELERLRLVDVTKSTQLYLQGETGFNHPSNLSIGVRQQIGPVELKARSDGVWSLGARYSTTF